MQHLRTNFTNGMPVTAADKNETNAVVNELIDIAAKSVVYEELTYSEIIDLIAQNALVPGAFYRMTDFVTTAVDERETAQFRSAEHPFDLLLQALTTNKLSAKAAALLHAEDTYFADAELNKWQIWYDINNDTNKYNWADADNGKGVIYRLIDEHNNDCPYDFKNIQFKRWAISDIQSNILTEKALDSLRKNLVYDMNGYRHMANTDIYGEWIPTDIQDIAFYIDDVYDWYYTFDGIMSEDGDTPGDHYDMSTHPFRLSEDCIQALFDEDIDVYFADYCKNNIIKSTYFEYYNNRICYIQKQILNNIVFNNGLSFCFFDRNTNEWIYRTQLCYANVFGSHCTYNTFGRNCIENIFGNSFSNNTLGNNCQGNTFKNYCTKNTIGDYYKENSCENDFCFNIFGGKVSANTFGGYFRNNILNFNCTSNTFNAQCHDNVFPNNCRYITVFEGVKYLELEGSGADSSFVQYAHILNGTSGTDDNNRLLVSITPDETVTQMVGNKSDGSCIIWPIAEYAV